MFIKNLLLKNFRNYEEELFEFSTEMNVLFGKNGQGKTNCAEAVFYLCTGTSPRTRRDKQLIRQGTDRAFISSDCQGMYGKTQISATITEGGREIKVNGNKITRNADVLGNMYAVFFSPQELRLIQDGPDERRRFLNVSVSQLSRPYFVALSRYNKILEQRNNLLKNRDLDVVYDTLPVWDAQLCKYAAVVAKKRSDYIKELAPLAEEAHAYLTDGKERLVISPERRYKGEEQDIEQKLFDDLVFNYERDIRLGFTASGPHRDDLDIKINGTDAKAYASQGQTRTAALSIKLAEVELFKNACGEPPVLILDDVMSELDLPRRKKLVGRCEGLQTIITCTHAERVLYGKTTSKIMIENGVIKR